MLKYPQYFESEYELASLMEFVLDGLHQNSKIAKEESDSVVIYKRSCREACLLKGETFGGYEDDYYR